MIYMQMSCVQVSLLSFARWLIAKISLMHASGSMRATCYFACDVMQSPFFEPGICAPGLTV